VIFPRVVMTAIITASMVLVGQTQERSTEPAPLGLAWGMTKAKVKATGVVLSDEKDGALGAEAFARNLPRVLADTEAVFLQFGFDDQLFRVGSVSKTWTNDRYGSQAVQRFDEIVSMISERYGKAQDLSRVPVDSFYAKSENFAYSISEKRRQHARQWSVGKTMISLSIGSSHYDTYYTLIYEDTARAANAKKGQRGREKEAL
jgi:hypothetical protein